MATVDRPLTFRTRHGRFTVRHASLMPAVLRYVRTLDAVIERRECGANAKGGGGFQAGNTCGKGDGGGKSSGPSEAVSISKKGTFLQAETDGGLVGGHVKDGALKITHAHLEPSKQGQGIGKAMYAKLIDEAHAQGLRVFSDTTVEVPAVRVYKSLEKDGYEVITNPHGVLPPSADLPDGAWYGTGDKPVFEVKPKKKGGAPAGEASETVKAWAQKAFSNPSHAENFVRWFGDSKVVGDNGEPLLVHKGMPRKDWKTGKDIDAVQSTNGPWAGFFSDDKAVADRFAQAFKFSGDTQTLSGYAVIRNPHVIDAGGKPAKSVQFDQVVDGPSGPKVQVAPRIKEIVDSGRFDGIIIKNTSDEGNVFVPFNPEGVKSSDNSGAFDPKSKNYKRSESRECGANAEGGGGFQPGNTCGKGDGGGGGGAGSSGLPAKTSSSTSDRGSLAKAYKESLSSDEWSVVGRWGQTSADVRAAQLKRADDRTPEEVRSIAAAESAFDKAPVYEGVAYRGIADHRQMPKELLGKISVGEAVGVEIEWGSDSSFSREENVAQKFAGATFVNNGRQSGPYEGRAVDTPGTVFVSKQSTAADILDATAVGSFKGQFDEHEVVVRRATRHVVEKVELISHKDRPELGVKKGEPLDLDRYYKWYFSGSEFSRTNLPPDFDYSIPTGFSARIYTRETKGHKRKT